MAVGHRIGTWRSVAVVGVALAGAVTGGCASSQQAKSHGAAASSSLAALNAGSLEVTRTRDTSAAPDQAPAATAPAPVSQKVAVDLVSGRTTITDAAGEFAGTLEPAWVDRLRGTIKSNAWRVGSVGPLKGTTDVTRYTLHVETATQGKHTASWAVPPEKPLPAAMQTFDDLINRADRFAHPLSERIDLLE